MLKLEEIKNLIPGCFGSDDKIFALYPTDEQQAKVVVKHCKALGLSFEDCLNLFQNFLEDTMTTSEHFDNQSGVIKKFVHHRWK